MPAFQTSLTAWPGILLETSSILPDTYPERLGSWPSADNACCLQDLLDDANPKSPAQAEAFMLFTNNKTEYKRRVKEQTKRNPVPS